MLELTFSSNVAMKYCCHVWAGASSYYLELLDKLQKRIYRTVDLSLAASLEPLAHRRNLIEKIEIFFFFFLQHYLQITWQESQRYIQNPVRHLRWSILQK